MKKLFISIFIVLLGPLWGHGQHHIKNLEELNGFKAIPKETVFVHFNDNLLLTGEYLYYKIYCLNAKDRTPSKISKIGYVELVGRNGKSVFKHKIRLTSGLGQGDFFIPLNVTSGHYKLIGYTQWMINEGEEAFFVGDIVIVNPYQELPKVASTESNNALKLTKRDSLGHSVNSSVFSNQATSSFEIELPKKDFGKRKSVNLKIISSASDNAGGNYSISVRKKNPIELPFSHNTFDFVSGLSSPENTKVLKINDHIYLPELRGELISGKILSNTDGSPISNQDISLSISGNEGIAKISRSDANGVFYFNLDGSDRKSDMLLEILEGDNEESKIVLDSTGPLNMKSSDFKEITLSADLNPIIQERSIFNQIESAFFEQKADSTLVVNSGLPVYRDFQEAYALDDYKRFKTLRETLIEIIENVFIKKIKGKPTLQVRSEDEFFVDSEDSPLLLVDGIVVQDLNDLLEYDIKKIDQINISRNEYYIGPKRYQGIVSVETKQDDYAQQIKTDDLLSVEIDGPLQVKEYYFQDYSRVADSNTNHLADFRQQLLWRPNVEMTGEVNLEFFTSDNTGDFEICLEGFTSSGKPISLSETFHVE